MTLENFKVWLRGYLLGADVSQIHIDKILHELNHVEKSPEYNLLPPAKDGCKPVDSGDVVDKFIKEWEEKWGKKGDTIYPPPQQPWYPPQYPWETTKIWCENSSPKIIVKGYTPDI